MVSWFDGWWAYCDFRAGCVEAARRSLEAVEAACDRAKSAGLPPCPSEVVVAARIDGKVQEGPRFPYPWERWYSKMLQTAEWTWWRELTFIVDGANARFETASEYSGCDERLERARTSLELAKAKLSVLQQHVDCFSHGQHTPAAWVRAGCGDEYSARPTTYRHELAASRTPRIREYGRNEQRPWLENGTGVPVYDRPPSFVDATFSSQQGESGCALASYSALPSCTDVGEVARGANGVIELRPAVDMLETLLAWAEQKAVANGVALPYLAGSTPLGLPALQGGGFGDATSAE
jgi:hypothetical protein